MMTSTAPTGTVQVDDLRIAYRERGEGPAVLLLHGWPTSSYLWREVMVPIAEANRVIALDLPGYGASDKPLDRRYDFDLFERAIDGVLDALDVGRTGLVVHDLGGPIGVHWALRNPTRVTHLAMLNTLVHPGEPTGLLADLLDTLADPDRYHQLTGPEGLETIMRLGMADPSRLTPEVLAAVVEPFRTPEAQQALAAAGTQLSPDGLAEIGERITELTMPVHLIYGVGDPALPVATEFARLKAELPQAVVTALDDCGHFLQEEAPDRIGTLLADFFGGRGGRGQGPAQARRDVV